MLRVIAIVAIVAVSVDLYAYGGKHFEAARTVAYRLIGR
jgi:hypothetical protein